jgi:hypothetical protein
MSGICARRITVVAAAKGALDCAAPCAALLFDSLAAELGRYADPMKFVTLSLAEANSLVDEIRAMAELPPGANLATLARARETRTLLQGQAFATPTSIQKADAAYRDLEILLHDHRWKDELSLDVLRKRIKSSCERLRAHLGLSSRPSA